MHSRARALGALTARSAAAPRRRATCGTATSLTSHSTSRRDSRCTGGKWWRCEEIKANVMAQWRRRITAAVVTMHDTQYLNENMKTVTFTSLYR